MSSNSKKGKGRRKIEIKKIEHKGYLQVAFSRRRNGIFKKASELSTLCGAESAIIVFSPAGKPFSFGYPNVDTVIQRYLSNGMFPPSKDSTVQLIDFHRTAKVHDLNCEYTKLVEQLEATKKRGEELKKLVSVYANKFDIEKLDLQELEQLKKVLQGLQGEMAQRFDEIFSTAAPPMSQFPEINDNDMLFNDPYEFGYQMDSDLGALNAVPQYYNFNYGDGTF
ncbi:hypothetical protein Syun_026565 [Stephania yunnanensis]|uniref:MADS-box domain-containing protein n=1 Tax=Stephania yunnanensis TaxID=152371 RepID=A0AAP0ETU4_9MAGN